MKRHSPFVLLTICLSCSLAAVVQAQTRGGTRDRDDLRYEHRYAFVVGINYEGSHVVKILQNAERDAQEMAEVLEQDYGFDCELLLGAKATKKAIESRLLEYRKQVKERDCFLFYFAGHGKNLGSYGYVFPSDVEADTLTSGLKHTDIVPVVEDLKAQHRLIILDSCFSGTLLKHLEANRGGPTDEVVSNVDRALFDARSLQALTAGASTEEVPDGQQNSAHSPFAESLLSQLRTRLGSEDRPFFTAKGLALRVTLDLQNGKQHPQFSYNEKEGQFHFFPVGAGEVTKVATAKFYQTLPGTPGEWWFDEMPWLTPAARLSLDKNPERLYPPDDSGAPTRSAGLPDPFDFAVYTSLRRTIEGLANDSLRGPQPLRAKSLLKLRGKRDRVDDAHALNKQATEAVLREVLSTLPASSDESPATDLHLRALILHKQGNEGATAAYESAIEKYGDQQTGLKLRCLADFGKWCTDQQAFTKARELFERAIDALPTGETDEQAFSPFFRFELLCGLAYSHRKLKNWETAENYYKDQAGKLLDKEQISPQHPVRAFLAERCAWNLMDQWHVKDAKKCFAKAGSIRTAWLDESKQQDTADYFNMKLSQLKVDHGLAVAARLTGESPVGTYEAIQEKLQDEIEIVQASSQKWALVGQLVNTTERLGDYFLFQGRTAADGALNLYRDALDQVDETEPSTKTLTKEKLLCKLAMAAMLAADTNGLRTAEEGLHELDQLISPKDDMERLADATAGNEKQGAPTLVRQLADIFQEVADEETRQSGLDKLRTVVTSNAGKEDARDDQELLLLAARTLTDEQQSEDARILATLVPKKPNAEEVRFYRVHYDRYIEQRAGFVGGREDLIALAKFVQKVKNQKTSSNLRRGKPFVVYYFPRSGGKVIVLAGNPRRDHVVRRLDFGIDDVDELTPEAIASVDAVLADLQIPDGAQVHWDDDTLLDLPEYPFKFPRQPLLSRLSQ